MKQARRKIMTVAAAAGMLGATLVWNSPAQAVAHKGLNGLIVCGGAQPNGTTVSVDFEVFVMNPDGSGRTNVTDENPITDFLKSREGRATVNTVTRGVFGVLKEILK